MKNRYKFIIFAGVIAAIFLFYGFDTLITKSYQINVISVSPKEVPADGQTQVTVKVQVKQNGTPKKSHTIVAGSGDGGGFKSRRVTTNADGIAVFTYFPYLKTNINQLVDIHLYFSDESNSVFFSIPAGTATLLKTVAPANTNTSTATNDGIFS